MRRRRFLAGFVALGVISPGALAKEKTACEYRLTPKDPNSRIELARGGVHIIRTELDDPIAETRLAAVRAKRIGRAAHVGDLPIHGVIALDAKNYPEKGDVFSSQWLYLRLLELDKERPIPFEGGRTYRFEFAKQDLAESFEVRQFGNSMSKYFRKSELSFGALSGDLRVFVTFDGTPNPEVPDVFFDFSAQDLNEAFRLAGEGLRIAKKARENKDCEITPFTNPIPDYGDCFLTTAAVETIGLPDDCWELETLRRFRDEWLADQPGGNEDIARYYDGAPAIADRLRACPRRLAQLYFTGILPSALAARFGLSRLARSIYSHHMRKLARSKV